MEDKKLTTKEKFLYLLKNKYLWIAIAILLISIIANLFASYYLEKRYGRTLPILNDIILDNLPYLKVAWLYDILGILMYFNMGIYAFKHKIEDFPYFVLLFAIFHFLRSLFIILTPLGVPNGGGQGLFKDATGLQGEYPSGHTADAFSIFLFTKGAYKKIALFFVLAIIILLLLGRGHYTIDIFSAIIFSYAIYAFGERFLKEKFKKRK
jgi:membrane-associated phospholipid phosphatase